MTTSVAHVKDESDGPYLNFTPSNGLLAAACISGKKCYFCGCALHQRIDGPAKI